MDLHVKTIHSATNEKYSLPPIAIQNLDFCLDKMISEQQKDPNYYYNHSIDNHQQQQPSDNDLVMMTHHATTSNPIWLPADKHPQIAPKEYQHWIETHEADKEHTKVTVTRKRSVLSTVSYQSEDSNSSHSSSDDDITPPTTPTTELDYPTIPEPENRQTSRSPSPQPQQTGETIESRTKHSNKQEQPIKPIAVTNDSKQNNRKSWLSGLFGDNNKNKVKTVKKKTSISNFFTKTLSSKTPNVVNDTNKNKKKGELTRKQQAKTPIMQKPIQPIPTRYTIQTERAIYRLSHFKLNNPRRPLQQQVTISNMMYWYLSISERQQKQKQIYFNQICQATFEPPPPGGVVTAGVQYHHHQSTNYEPPSATTIKRSTSTPLPFSKDTKKKYKPVRNTEYQPVNNNVK